MSAVEEYREFKKTGDEPGWDEDWPFEALKLADAAIAELEAERDEVEAMLRLSVAEWGGLRPDPDMPVDDDYYITQLRERVRAERRPV